MLNGLYKARIWLDISIFRNSLQSHLSLIKRVEADDGYVGEAPLAAKCSKSFVNPEETKWMQA